MAFSSGQSPVIRDAALVAGYAVVVVGLTWPLASHLGTHLPAPGFAGDALYSAWTLAWQTQALSTDPARIADAAWGLFLPAACVGAALPGAGLTGAWMGGVVYVAVLGLALHWRFQSGAWERARI